MKPIRVLHIVGIMNMGGLENLIMNIYRKIDRDKIQFDFLVTREEEGIFDSEIKSLGGNVYNIPHMSKVGYSKYKKSVYEFFKCNPQYQIVHCHRDAMCSVYLKQAKKANVPVRIAHSHNIMLAESKNIKGKVITIMKKYFMMSTNSNTTDYFACSKDAGRWLFGKKIADEKLKVITNGIDTDRYIYDESIRSELRKELGVSEGTLLIGHVGRFDIQKNHEFLIDVINNLDKEIEDYKVCLVGNGILIEEIKNKVNKLNLQDKVMFSGIRNNVNELMMAFDIFTFPSLFEGLGIALVEAQATGVQCLASDTVPRESDMKLELLEYLPIDNGEQWVDKIKILNERKENLRLSRNSSQSQIKDNGYDILSTIQYLQEFYIDNHKNKA